MFGVCSYLIFDISRRFFKFSSWPTWPRLLFFLCQYSLFFVCLIFPFSPQIFFLVGSRCNVLLNCISAVRSKLISNFLLLTNNGWNNGLIQIWCVFGKKYFCQLILLFSLFFLLLFMGFIVFFGNIHRSYCTILANFIFYF